MYSILNAQRNRKFRGFPLSTRINRASVHALVTRAYFKLVLVPWDAKKSRVVTLAKSDNREVRLVELLEPGSFMPNLWMELYDLDNKVALDSCACGDLESAAKAAEQLLEQAGVLQPEGGSAPEKDEGDADSNR
jgi:hypothetical protein